MRSALRIRLLDGLAQDGVQHRNAELRPLNGADEDELPFGSSTLPAELATAVLAATTLRIGSLARPGAAAVRALSIGDRERLMLGVFAASFGSRPTLVARCSESKCGGLIELPVDLSDILAAGLTSTRPGPVIEVDATAGPLKIELRQLDGADLELVSRIAQTDLCAARKVLLTKSIVRVTDLAGHEIESTDVPEHALADIERWIAEYDPATEATTSLSCPHCGCAVEVVLDALSLLKGEVLNEESLLVQVHRLARAYHWSEHEIMSLPTGRRRRYLSLIQDAEVPQ